MRRFFTEPESITESTAVLTGADAKHIRQVLRLGVNEQIELFDGTGAVYLSKIQSIDKRSVTARIKQSVAVQPPPPFLFVGQSMLKGKKMDFLYQKLTELSVEGLYPFWSQFSETRTNQDKQLERWRRISMEACKQSKRPTILQCPPPVLFKELLAEATNFDTKIIFWEKEDVQFLSPFPQLSQQPCSTLVLLGPEGGFADSEIKEARANGFTTVSLGPRVLRAETAAISATAIIQNMLGNLSRTETISWEIPR